MSDFVGYIASDGSVFEGGFTSEGGVGPIGPQGPQGEQGPQGIQGIQGIQGVQGPAGADGQDGQDGYTPVKGVDYFTAAEISDIEDEVAASIDLSGKQDKLTAGTNITIDENNVISASGGGATYTAGTNIDITSDVISTIGDTIKELSSDLLIDDDGLEGTYVATTTVHIQVNPNLLISVVQVTKGGYVIITKTDTTNYQVIALDNGIMKVAHVTYSYGGSMIDTATYDLSGMEKTSNKVTSISTSSTNTQYPSAKLLYDQLELKQIKFATPLTADLYLADGTYPTLTKGYYYTNGHSIYINGNVKTEFNDTIFFVDPANASTCLIYASIQPQNDTMVRALYSGGVWLYSTNTLLQLSNINTSMPLTPTDDKVPSTKLFKTELSLKQNTLTAGSNISISGNTISATDTTYSAFTGTDGSSAGTSGLVPAPATTDDGKFLCADGTWQTAGGGGTTITYGTTDLTPRSFGTSRRHVLLRV